MVTQKRYSLRYVVKIMTFIQKANWPTVMRNGKIRHLGLVAMVIKGCFSS